MGTTARGGLYNQILLQIDHLHLRRLLRLHLHLLVLDPYSHLHHPFESIAQFKIPPFRLLAIFCYCATFQRLMLPFSVSQLLHSLTLRKRSGAKAISD
jgi:hypothetical protein